MQLETSDILAFIAIVISVVSMQFTKHTNKVNLEADYFKTLYSQHLLYDLPRARRYLRFHENRLVDYGQLLDEIEGIIGDSLYFRYADRDFYENAKNFLQNLEDYLIEMGEKNLNGTEQENVSTEIQVKLERIYELFNDKFIGN